MGRGSMDFYEVLSQVVEGARELYEVME